MTINTSVHAYFILSVMSLLSEPTEAPSVLMLSPSRDETSLSVKGAITLKPPVIFHITRV